MADVPSCMRCLEGYKNLPTPSVQDLPLLAPVSLLPLLHLLLRWAILLCAAAVAAAPDDHPAGSAVLVWWKLLLHELLLLLPLLKVSTVLEGGTSGFVG
ncbi:hypothetical protein Taro_014174 [Colocasia esculenta]|uniref:Uncharacterized protein n=1 Tax=Colocasia esculenta TaxID=4460 RepID=A0A843UE63_COLES|nr:hypothetical protein [Colocasia esculenta]